MTVIAVGGDHYPRARRNVSGQMGNLLPALRQWPRCRMSARTRADPIQIGAQVTKDRQIEHDDQGQ